MLRKLSLAVIAATALGAAALAPTSASAWWHGGWHGWHGGWWGGPHFYYGAYPYHGCRRWVETPWGPRLRWVC
ncbi:MAG TPA: sulfur globule protein precursor [Xanthobacteraceae bacterium]|nr:sulfur globule protein precursor [Xanthobacteraceae bacterium]